MEIIAKIKNNFTGKFGVPRQSGLTPSVISEIIFEPNFRNTDYIRGIEQFSHIWLVWEFSESKEKEHFPTVRPPRLGGNKKIGVFATRSPFRPNNIGLSCVKIVSVNYNDKHGAYIKVAGADLMNNTPIFDIKPYIPYSDCINEANGGFTDVVEKKKISVYFPDEFNSILSENQRQEITEIIQLDPRPAYQHNPERIYGMKYSSLDIKFSVINDVAIIKRVN